MSANRELLVRAARKLGVLVEELVFVGGAIVELYLTDPASPRVRPTTDTDVICEVTTYTAYYRLGERLRELGFRQHVDRADPVYRWRSGADVVDVMPIDPRVLGFSNEWYPLAIRTSIPFDLEPELTIRIPVPAVFLASKLAAHEGRGVDDPLMSQDLEDVVALLAGRPELPDEVASGTVKTRRWIASRLKRHLPPESREERIAAFLPETRVVTDLLPLVLERLERLCRQEG